MIPPIFEKCMTISGVYSAEQVRRFLRKTKDVFTSLYRCLNPVQWGLQRVAAEHQDQSNRQGKGTRSREQKTENLMMDPHLFSSEKETSDANRCFFGDCPQKSGTKKHYQPELVLTQLPSNTHIKLFSRLQKYRAEPPEPSCVSMKSSDSMDHPPKFRNKRSSTDLSCVRNLTLKDHSKSDVCDQIQTDPVCLKESMKQDYCQPVDDVLHRVVPRHKTSMKNRYESLFEGFKTHQNKTLLNRIYTQLYIIDGESEGVIEEHEVLQIEKKLWNQHWQDTPINCLDIFKPVQCTVEEMEEDNIRALRTEDERHEERTEDNSPQVQKLRSVMTKGIAGIGKTVSVQKFILDWAEGKANQDVDLMFVFQFRELNLIKDHQYSLQGLLCDFHPKLKDLDTKTYDECKMVFIFDGLDESRIPLNFLQSEKVTDITKVSSVELLMTNLIKGELLPSALIWITSRPAAANQIPSQYINRVTEIQGFNDPQKEEYFRKRISDQDQAHSVISHIKKTRSLHIMCHIPVFCWISATVLQHIMKQGHTEIPKTLTAMYSHFLWTQTIMRSEKYEDRGETDPEDLLGSNRQMLLKLAELAFKQLMKGNVVFYEEDLRECSIDVTEASVYSGICTEIFREESVLHQRKVYCFVHLSFQEFLAALYVFHCYVSKNMEELQFLKTRNTKWPYRVSLEKLLREAVCKALESKNGHLDLFLRFLLGISLESNQQLLKDLLTQTVRSSESIKQTVQYIKDIIQKEDLPSDRSINLFLCLTEMNDQSLSSSIQEYLKSEKSSRKELSPAECLALAYMLVTSEEVLDELNLKNYRTSEMGYLRLIPAVSNCRKAILAGCKLTMNSCETLSAALKSINSPLKELDLSNTDPEDSGVKLLSAGLKSSNSKLEILRLSGCMVTEEGCSYLASALSENPSHLKELDLSYNHPGDTGVKLLSDRLEDPHCRLDTLRFVDDTTVVGLISSEDVEESNSSYSTHNLRQHCGVCEEHQVSGGAHCGRPDVDHTHYLFCQEGTAAPSLPTKDEKSKPSPSHPYNILQRNNRVHPDQQPHSLVWQLHRLRPEITPESGEDLSSGSHFHRSRCRSRATKIVRDPTHPSHGLFRLLPSGKCYCSMQCRTAGLSRSFFPQAIRLLNAVDSSFTECEFTEFSFWEGGMVSLEPWGQCGAVSVRHHVSCNMRTVDHGGKEWMKPGLKKYSCELTLDPNTVNRRLSLCEENRKVVRVREEQSYPDHPERFDVWEQVLCRESLTGRCYWEAEWSGEVYIAVTYKGIRRKRGGMWSDCEFGQNVKSWSLSCYNKRFTVWHNNDSTVLSAPFSHSKRVGVYLDCPAGTLSFYSVSTDTHTLTHLHTVNTTFTEPLYAGFWVGTDSSVCVRP
ncbi:hypothetical protein NFI96_027833 [Prochilodus magdalenae]|nr:hypothetical protein NFI96_027833 [Prochilodus magdalenae]